MHKITISSLLNKFITATAILALMLAALPLLPVSAAGSITVDVTDDEYLNNSSCSLREAIIAANTNASFFGCTYVGTGPDDIITLASGTTYALSRIGTTATNGDLDIGNVDGTSGNLTIQASGTTNAIIDASAIGNRVMEVDSLGNTNLTLIHITLTGGNSPDGAGLYFAGDGTLTLTNSRVSGNTATSEANCGAGIFNSSFATVIINDSTIADNTCTAAGADGAGLLKAVGGTLTITNSTFSNNATPDNGGGVRIDMEGGTATITNSTFVDNFAGSRGGGLQVKSGTVTVDFSTFSGNTANYAGPSTGGAVQATGGSVTVLQSILANSLPNSITGADCDQLLPGTVTVTNSLVEHNSDCTGTIVSNSDPMLDTLADNGGPTMTLALLPGSPAINIADDAGCPAADQRGITRPQGAHCDLGAFEYQPGTLTLVKRVVNNSGGSATVADFGITTSAGALTFGSGVPDGTNTLKYTSNTFTVNAGSYTFSEINRSDYTEGTWSCTGATATGTAYNSGSVTVPHGGAVICTITNDDWPVFSDVLPGYWAWSYIERLYNAGVTTGCSASPLMYCPANPVTRAQMAIFLLVGEHGSAYTPPAVGVSTGFNDVPTDHWAAAWIKQLAAESITAGCGNGNFCPDAPVTRDQMAVFLLRAEHGSSYAPPPATGIFTDVPADYWAAAWIERLAAEGITGGCGNGNFCPGVTVTRDQMAVFLVKAFNLP